MIEIEKRAITIWFLNSSYSVNPVLYRSLIRKNSKLGRSYRALSPQLNSIVTRTRSTSQTLPSISTLPGIVEPPRCLVDASHSSRDTFSKTYTYNIYLVLISSTLPPLPFQKLRVTLPLPSSSRLYPLINYASTNLSIVPSISGANAQSRVRPSLRSLFKLLSSS